jgi:uncharacterized protein (DUF2147 family)
MFKPARFVFASALGVLVFVASAAIPAGAGGLTPVGTWATSDAKSHIQIKECGGKLCGTIVWLKEPLDEHGKDQLDSENPDPRLRTRKILGMALLSGFVPDQNNPNVWTGGRIYDPDNGKTYSCTLTLENPNTLNVRGYVGLSILGETRTWTRTD